MGADAVAGALFVFSTTVDVVTVPVGDFSRIILLGILVFLALTEPLSFVLIDDTDGVTAALITNCCNL
jgi:hypothetical protein